MVREALEGLVSPTVATSLLFEAIEAAGAAPETVDEMHAFARGPLDSAVRRRFTDDVASELGMQFERLFARAQAGDLDIDVEVDSEDGTATAQMPVVRRPVPVVVLAGVPTMSERLVSCLGEDRVHATHVATVGDLVRETFARAPLLVLVDLERPTADPVSEVVPALTRLPDATVAVIWCGAGTARESLLERASALGCSPVVLDRREGIEPFLDLVLSRFVRASEPPRSEPP